MENSHINESILSEEILEDQKKNRIESYDLPSGMEDIGSDSNGSDHKCHERL